MLLLRRFPVVVVPALWLSILLSAKTLATDFYPLHFAARAILAGQSPYGQEATEQLMHVWNAPFASAGIAYPLPLILLIVPLAVVPFALAAALWTGLGTMMAGASLWLRSDSRNHMLLPFLFLPLHRAIVMGQATLLWFGLAVLLILAVEKKRSWLAGLCIALLILKPQNGIMFALAGLWWAWHEDKRTLLNAGIAASSLGSITLLIQPDWFHAWNDQVNVYRTIVQPVSVLPWGILLLAACWRLDWWAKIAILQVILFPLSDLYSTLPLLIAWVSIGGPLALFGAAVSWLWQFLQLPNSIWVVWVVLIVPLMAAALWRSWGNSLREQFFTKGMQTNSVHKR